MMCCRRTFRSLHVVTTFFSNTTRRIRRFISSLFAQGVSEVFEWGCIIERLVYLLRRVFSGSG